MKALCYFDFATPTAISDGDLRPPLPGGAPSPNRPHRTPELACSLLATVHGQCTFALNGTFQQLEEKHPREAALARVREALVAAGA